MSKVTFKTAGSSQKIIKNLNERDIEDLVKDNDEKKKKVETNQVIIHREENTWKKEDIKEMQETNGLQETIVVQSKKTAAKQEEMDAMQLITSLMM
jgi:hypothetical protein